MASNAWPDSTAAEPVIDERKNFLLVDIVSSRSLLNELVKNAAGALVLLAVNLRYSPYLAAINFLRFDLADLRTLLITKPLQPSSRPLNPNAWRLHFHRSKESMCSMMRPS